MGFHFLKRLNSPVTLITCIFFSLQSLALGEISPQSSEPPLIVYIQDAHGDYVAQKSIRQHLEDLRRKQGIDLVFVEGAAGALDRQYLQFDTDPEINRRIIDKLVRMGELSGADLYLLKEKAPKIQFVGLENPELYRENLKLFRKVFTQENRTQEWLRAERARLDREFSRLGQKDLLSLIRVYLDFDSKKNLLKESLLLLDGLSQKYLLRNLHKAREQKQFPNLVRLLRLMEDENKIDLEAAAGEAKKIQDLLPPGRERRKWKSFLTQLVLPEGHFDTNPRFLMEKLYSVLESKNFDFRKYPHLSQLGRNRIYQYEIQSAGLFKEVRRWMSLLMDALAEIDEAKRIIQKVRRFVLTSKLLTLELTREEYEIVRSSDFSRYVGATEVATTNALAFYQVAVVREKAFWDTIQRVLKEKKKSSAIVITGGFHTGGLVREFDKDQIKHTVLSPRVGGDARNFYVNSLLEKYQDSLSLSQIPKPEWALSPELQAALGASLGARKALVDQIRGALGVDGSSDSKASSLGDFIRTRPLPPDSGRHRAGTGRKSDRVKLPDPSDHKEQPPIHWYALWNHIWHLRSGKDRGIIWSKIQKKLARNPYHIRLVLSSEPEGTDDAEYLPLGRSSPVSVRWHPVSVRKKAPKEGTSSRTEIEVGDFSLDPVSVLYDKALEGVLEEDQRDDLIRWTMREVLHAEESADPMDWRILWSSIWGYKGDERITMWEKIRESLLNKFRIKLILVTWMRHGKVRDDLTRRLKTEKAVLLEENLPATSGRWRRPADQSVKEVTHTLVLGNYSEDPIAIFDSPSLNKIFNAENSRLSLYATLIREGIHSSAESLGISAPVAYGLPQYRIDRLLSKEVPAHLEGMAMLIRWTEEVRLRLDRIDKIYERSFAQDTGYGDGRKPLTLQEAVRGSEHDDIHLVANGLFLDLQDLIKKKMTAAFLKSLWSLIRFRPLRNALFSLGHVLSLIVIKENYNAQEDKVFSEGAGVVPIISSDEAKKWIEAHRKERNLFDKKAGDFEKGAAGAQSLGMGEEETVLSPVLDEAPAVLTLNDRYLSFLREEWSKHRRRQPPDPVSSRLVGALEKLARDQKISEVKIGLYPGSKAESRIGILFSGGVKILSVEADLNEIRFFDGDEGMLQRQNPQYNWPWLEARFSENQLRQVARADRAGLLKGTWEMLVKRLGLDPEPRPEAPRAAERRDKVRRRLMTSVFYLVHRGGQKNIDRRKEVLGIFETAFGMDLRELGDGLKKLILTAAYTADPDDLRAVIRIFQDDLDVDLRYMSVRESHLRRVVVALYVVSMYRKNSSEVVIQRYKRFLVETGVDIKSLSKPNLDQLLAAIYTVVMNDKHSALDEILTVFKRVLPQNEVREKWEVLVQLSWRFIVLGINANEIEIILAEDSDLEGLRKALDKQRTKQIDNRARSKAGLLAGGASLGKERCLRAKFRVARDVLGDLIHFGDQSVLSSRMAAIVPDITPSRLRGSVPKESIFPPINHSFSFLTKLLNQISRRNEIQNPTRQAA